MQRRWVVGRTKSSKSRGFAALDGLRTAVEETERCVGTTPSSYFLVSPDLKVDVVLARLLTRSRFRTLAETTQLNYVHDLRLFFDFLWDRNKAWAETTTEDVEDWVYFRTLSAENNRKVGKSKINREEAAIKKLLELAGRVLVAPEPRPPDEISPFASAPSSESFRSLEGCEPSGIPGGERFIEDMADREASPDKRSKAKWLPDLSIRKWLDVGLRGLDWQGSEDAVARARVSDRNTAFVELLYGTGLRSAEAHALTVLDVPENISGRGLITRTLPGLIAKGGVQQRTYYIDHTVVRALRTYLELSRVQAVKRAQGRRLYDDIAKIIVHESSSGPDPKLRVEFATGDVAYRKLSSFTADQRARLFWRRDGLFEPLALWLAMRGTPLALHSWQSVFNCANERSLVLAPTENQSSQCTPHMLRHSFAMKMLIAAHRSLDRRYGLSPEERRDFSALYDEAFDIVRDLLGHSSVEVTRSVYLRPIRDLKVREAMLDIHSESWEAADDAQNPIPGAASKAASQPR